MLNRRILRIKVFKEVYSYAENNSLTLKEALSEFDASCEAVRDLYLFMMSFAVPLAREAVSRIEAAGRKFYKSEEDLHPNTRFAANAFSALLAEDAEFNKFITKKKLSWDQYDVLIRNVYDSVCSKEWFKAYMEAPESSLKDDCRLFYRIFEEEFVENAELEKILEDLDIYWNDDLAYALTWCCTSCKDIARTGRWTLPPLYQSEVSARKGKVVDSDRDFAVKLLQCAYAGYGKYYQMVSDSVSKFDKDRLFTTDVVLCAVGLAEAENFSEIPVKVTINEYVEISKFYSTPKSRAFVNGILDRLIRKLSDEGKIVKKND